MQGLQNLTLAAASNWLNPGNSTFSSADPSLCPLRFPFISGLPSPSNGGSVIGGDADLDPGIDIDMGWANVMEEKCIAVDVLEVGKGCE
jgi:hypothetical protein